MVKVNAKFCEDGSALDTHRQEWSQLWRLCQGQYYQRLGDSCAPQNALDPQHQHSLPTSIKASCALVLLNTIFTTALLQHNFSSEFEYVRRMHICCALKCAHTAHLFLWSRKVIWEKPKKVGHFLFWHFSIHRLLSSNFRQYGGSHNPFMTRYKVRTGAGRDLS